MVQVETSETIREREAQRLALREVRDIDRVLRELGAADGAWAPVGAALGKAAALDRSLAEQISKGRTTRALGPAVSVDELVSAGAVTPAHFDKLAAATASVTPGAVDELRRSVGAAVAVVLRDAVELAREVGPRVLVDLAKVAASAVADATKLKWPEGLASDDAVDAAGIKPATVDAMRAAHRRFELCHCVYRSLRTLEAVPTMTPEVWTAYGRPWVLRHKKRWGEWSRDPMLTWADAVARGAQPGVFTREQAVDNGVIWRRMSDATRAELAEAEARALETVGEWSKVDHGCQTLGYDLSHADPADAAKLRSRLAKGRERAAKLRAVADAAVLERDAIAARLRDMAIPVKLP